MLGWLRALPDELLHRQARAQRWYAGALLSSGELEGVEARLRDAERVAGRTAAIGARPDAPAAKMVVVDEEAFRLLPGSIAVWRAGLGPGSGRCGRHRDIRPSGARPDPRGRPPRAWRRQWRCWGSPPGRAGISRPPTARLPMAMAHVQRAGHISDAISCAIALADIRIAQGRLREAMRTYEQALQLAAEQGDPVMRGTADMYVG